MTDTAYTLDALSDLQASRLQKTDYHQALEQARFDPYPDGTATTGAEPAARAGHSGAESAEITGAPLSGFDGALPDHILEALQYGVHNDDTGLRDFLGIFDKRLKQLDLRIRRASMLVASQDKGSAGQPSVLSRFARLGQNRDNNPRYTELLLPLLSPSRSLENLQAILGWWTGRPTTVRVHFNTRHPIRKESHSRISTCHRSAAQLGDGALLGKTARTPTGHIEVLLQCENTDELKQMAESDEALCTLRRLITRYLRAPVPVTIYAQVQRKMLSSPRLSVRPEKSFRLGAYNMLCPEKRPDHGAKIKLTVISA